MARWERTKAARQRIVCIEGHLWSPLQSQLVSFRAGLDALTWALIGAGLGAALATPFALLLCVGGLVVRRAARYGKKYAPKDPALQAAEDARDAALDSLKQLQETHAQLQKTHALIAELHTAQFGDSAVNRHIAGLVDVTTSGSASVTTGSLALPEHPLLRLLWKRYPPGPLKPEVPPDGEDHPDPI